MTKMAVLGRGSMRNKQQEEELRNSSEPKHAHLQEDLHVEITAFASPAEAHARLAFALTQVGKDCTTEQHVSGAEILDPRLQRPDPAAANEGDPGDEEDGERGVPGQRPREGQQQLPGVGHPGHGEAGEGGGLRVHPGEGSQSAQGEAGVPLPLCPPQEGQGIHWTQQETQTDPVGHAHQTSQ